MYLINTPWFFKMIWAMAKGWVDERTRKRITITGENHLEVLSKIIDMKYIPSWAGGNNHTELIDDVGPWNEYELVDGHMPGDEVGVYRKDDPYQTIFTPTDMMALTNPAV
jgi:hypothetical protein